MKNNRTLYDVSYKTKAPHCKDASHILIVVFADSEQDAIKKADHQVFHVMKKHNLGYNFFVVKFVVVIATIDVGFQNDFSQVPFFGILKKWNKTWFLESKDPFPIQVSCLSHISGTLDNIIG